MNVPSEEQQLIIEAAVRGECIIVDAVAGSGKTTTILNIAARLPHVNILNITYNKALKFEVREKARACGIGNIVVHTYHSLASAYYFGAPTDAELLAIKDAPPIKAMLRAHYDLIIIDEAQDMVELYYQLVYCFICDTRVPQMIIMGDRYQGVYTYKNADTRFLTCEHVWQPICGRAFVHLTLSTSYRCTRQTAQFVNRVMIGCDEHNARMRAIKDGPDVRYFKTGWESANDVGNLIAKWIRAGLPPDDVFIIVPSISSNHRSPFRKMENKFTTQGIPIFVPNSETEDLSARHIARKLVFTTFHQSKGRERRIVVLLGFDSSYFKYYARDADPTECPPTLYVGATRASHWLIIQDSAGTRGADGSMIGRAQFTTTYEETRKYCEFVGTPDDCAPTMDATKLEKTIAVTKFSEIPSIEILELLQPLIARAFRCIEPEGVVVEMNSTTDWTHETRAQYGVGGDAPQESVSDLNGIAIPLMRYRGNIRALFRRLRDERIDNPSVKRAVQRELVKFGNIEADDAGPIEIARVLHLVNIWLARAESLIHRLSQITLYDWLTPEAVRACELNMGVIVGDVEIEVPVLRTLIYKRFSIEIRGNIDIMETRQNVHDGAIARGYEIKCIGGALRTEHFLQTLIYAWTYSGTIPFELLNIRTRERWQCVATLEQMNEIMQILARRYDTPDVIADDEFVDAICSARETVDEARAARTPTNESDDDLAAQMDALCIDDDEC